MKKILVAMLAVLLIGSFLFAGEETFRLKLSATVSEGPDNSGIRIMAGDMMEGITTPAGSEYNTYFGNLLPTRVPMTLLLMPVITLRLKMLMDSSLSLSTGKAETTQ